MRAAQSSGQRIDVGAGAVRAGRHPDHGPFGNAVAPYGVHTILFEQALLHRLRVNIRRHALQPKAY